MLRKEVRPPQGQGLNTDRKLSFSFETDVCKLHSKSVEKCSQIQMSRQTGNYFEEPRLFMTTIVSCRGDSVSFRQYFSVLKIAVSSPSLASSPKKYPTYWPDFQG